MFKPGVSGNPKGRPKKDYRLTELERICGTEALFQLLDIAMNPKYKCDDRLKVINIMMSRAGLW